MDAIGTRGGEPDAGKIWELDDQRWTHSRLSCVAGLRAVSRLHAPGAQAARWSALADAMLADADAELACTLRTLAAFPEGRADRRVATVPAIRGALPGADDPRTLCHAARAVLDELER